MHGGRVGEADLYTIVVASQKGGSGKTTLSGHLAVVAESAGVGPVALIDTDPQGSLSQWWNARQAPTPLFAKVGTLELKDALAQLAAGGVKLAVIDTPPAITGSIAEVVAHADLVIVPTRPSPHDLRAVGATVDIAERLKKPLIFVVNGATPRARITGEAAVALSQHGMVAPVTLHHRVDFAASMVDGRTVGEVLATSPSAREMRDLWTYLQERLARLANDADFLPVNKPDHFAVHSSWTPPVDKAPPAVAPAEPAQPASPASPIEPAPLPALAAASIPAEPGQPAPPIEPAPLPALAAAPIPAQPILLPVESKPVPPPPCEVSPVEPLLLVPPPPCEVSPVEPLLLVPSLVEAAMAAEAPPYPAVPSIPAPMLKPVVAREILKFDLDELLDIGIPYTGDDEDDVVTAPLPAVVVAPVIERREPVAPAKPFAAARRSSHSFGRRHHGERDGQALFDRSED